MNSNPKKKKIPKKINNVIQSIFKLYGQEKRLEQFNAVTIFNELTETERMKSLATSIDNNVLRINVINSAISNLMALKKNELIKKINSIAGEEIINNIIFTISNEEND